MYCIVFSGRLLDGHDPMTVRKAVAGRLNLDAEQVERLFSGKRVVLKKGVTEESGRVYLNVLRRLGMDAGIVRTPRAQDTVQALASFKVVFWGRTLDSFDRQAVMRAAAVKLKANPAQVERMFSGSKAVLKRGVPADVGSRYVVELARIGMQINLEVETLEERRAGATQDVAEAEVGEVVAAADEASRRARPPGFRRHDDEVYAGLLQTQYELPETAADYVEELTQKNAEPESRREVNVAGMQEIRPATPLLRETASKPLASRNTKSAEYVKCGSCGHRQASGSRCRACGADLARPQPLRGQIPMDASAYATQTTILGNMPAGLMRNSVAASPATGPAREMGALLAQSGGVAPGALKGLRTHAPVMVGVALVISVAVWLIF